MSLGTNETLLMWRRSRGSSAKREATVLVLLLYDRGRSRRGPEVMHVEHTCKGASFETVRLQAHRSGSQGVAVMEEFTSRPSYEPNYGPERVRVGRRLGPRPLTLAHARG